MTENSYDCTLKHPARILIFGPSFSGKSTLVSKIIDHHEEIFNNIFDRIIFCSDGSSLNLNKTIPIEQYEYLDKAIIDSLDKSINNCIIIDDFMHKAANDIQISEIFTKRSHHSNTTLIFLLQNVFPKSKYMTDIRRNATYLIFMSNPSDEKSIKLISHQIDPNNPNFLYSAYLDATKNKPFNYILIDLHQQQRDEVRYRTNIIPDGSTFVYLKIQEYFELCKRFGLNCEYKKRREVERKNSSS